MTKIKLHDKEFIPYIKEEDIQLVVKGMADAINDDFKDREHRPIFIGILDGSFRFMSDLLKHIDIECGLSFLKLSSYEGTETTGNVNQLIGLKEDIRDRVVIIVEDIVDTGITMDYVVEELMKYHPKEIKIVTLLFKPESYVKDLTIDYTGFEIPDDFVVGYGLDYDGLGRNLNAIYVVNNG